MANKKITELDEATSVSNDDWLVIVDVANDETKKVHASKVGGNIPVQDIAPANPSTNDLWIDTSDNDTLKYYDGSDWIKVSDTEVLDSYSTSQSKPYSTNYVNEKVNDINTEIDDVRETFERKYIKVRSTIKQNFTSVGLLEVLFNTVDYNVGNAFQLINGKVQVIDSNVHHVKATALLWVERAAGYAWCRLSKNSSIKASYMLDATATSSDWQSIEMSTIIDVTANDYIVPSVYFNTAANNDVNGTYDSAVQMIIEVLD